MRKVSFYIITKISLQVLLPVVYRTLTYYSWYIRVILGHLCSEERSCIPFFLSKRKAKLHNFQISDWRLLFYSMPRNFLKIRIYHDISRQGTT